MFPAPPGFRQRFAAPGVFAAGSLCVLLREGQVLVAEGEAARLPTWGEVSVLELVRTHVVGEWAQRLVLTAEAGAGVEPPAGFRWSGIRALFTRLPEAELALAGRAVQVLEWDRTHRFCGRCGAPTREREEERAKVCTACGYIAYPRVTPAIMVLVTRGRELLLARAPHFVPGVYSALAGFVEAGESLEETVHREVREEVGVDVEALAYFGSQSWPFPHSLMVAFTARYAGGEVVPQPGEIEDAQWFPIDRLPPLPSPVSISRRLIETTVAALAAS